MTESSQGLKVQLEKLPKKPVADDIPANATIRSEFTKCGKPNCDKLHGPYFYAYWKDGKKVKKRYIGKSWEAWENRQIAKAYGVSADFLEDLFAGKLD